MRVAPLPVLLLLLAACDTRTSEETLRDSAAEVLRASRERDYEAVWPLLSDDWRVAFGDAGLPDSWRSSFVRIVSVPWEGSPRARFLRTFRELDAVILPRLADAADANAIGPPWLFSPDLLAALSTDGLEIETPDPDSVDGSRSRKTRTVRLGVASFDSAPFTVHRVEFTFLEQEGAWRFLGSQVMLGSPSVQSELVLPHASTCVEVERAESLVVNALGDGRIEVMESPVSLPDLPSILGGRTSGPVSVRVDHLLRWERAAAVLTVVASGMDTELWLAACRLEDGLPESAPKLTPPPPAERSRIGRPHYYTFTSEGGMAMHFKSLYRRLVLDLAPFNGHGGLILLEVGREWISQDGWESLRSALEAFEGICVIVSAAPAAHWQTVVSAIDAARAAGIKEVRLARPGNEDPRSGIRINGIPLAEVRDADDLALPDHPALRRVIRSE